MHYKKLHVGLCCKKSVVALLGVGVMFVCCVSKLKTICST
jgi:hypothetical protein